ncbi:BrnT family toxin [Inquilinus limosus]|uniref:BrnT family toxin n=1 Tax=Inquilinus limosus TaxID=171674 RepID=UPI003F16CBC2
MSWRWDPRKAALNRKNHGVSFELAMRVFGDPFQLSILDPHPDEERWRTIGKPSHESGVVLFVVHTIDDEDQVELSGRIISARVAEPHERRAYEEGKFPTIDR